MAGRAARERRALGRSPDQPGGLVMIVIHCETGDDVEVAAETLIGANLSRLNLHRALLDGQDLRGADLSDTELRSAWLEGTIFEGAKLTRASLAASNASRASFAGADLREAM